MSHPPQINRILFVAASGLATPEERRAFLDYACRGDDARRLRIQSLLDASGEAEDFFQFQPQVDPTSIPDDLPNGENTSIGARIGPYRLIDRLGAGGCGVVYLAEQMEPVRRKVALKIIRLGMDTESVIARFAMERESLAIMDHPNIARVLDAGTTSSGRPFFVMELVDGERITSFCDRKKLTLRDRLRLFILICEAIQHAHQKGVIHRDIKPSNILVHENDGRPWPKVIDFGIAKATSGPTAEDGTITRAGHFLGTPAYMSPEQAAGSLDVDTRSDIYSLGVLLHELLTGEPPFRQDQFHEKTDEEIRNLIRDVEISPPSQKLRRLPHDQLLTIAKARNTDPQRLLHQTSGDLDWIVLKALEKDRRRRYETTNGLAMDIQRHLAEQPVIASPPSRRYLLLKLIRRNRISFTAAAIALSGLIAGLGTSTILFLRERAARQEQAALRIQADQARATEVRLREKASAAERLSQAAVLLRYEDLAAADTLIQNLPTALIPRSLEAADTLHTIADWHLTQSRGEIAANRFTALAAVITSVDLTDTDHMSRILMPAATAIKEWGKPEDYLLLRQLAIQRFADSSNDGVAAHVSKAVLLAPADPSTLAQVKPLADKLRQTLLQPATNKSPYLLAWRCFSMALFDYRSGELDAALHWIEKSQSLPLSPRPAQLTASCQILTAMIRVQQDRIDDARALLDPARSAIENWQAAPFNIGTTTDLWFDWVNARILLQEAQTLLPPT